MQWESADGNFDLSFTDRDCDSSYDSNSTKITFENSSANAVGSSVNISGTDVTISSEGTYILTGDCSDGSVTVDAGDNDKIQLVFDNINLTSSKSPIVITNADKVFVTLADNSENTLNDASSYTLTVDNSSVDATIFSKADLSINGSGKLTVKGNYKHGIVSKDDLVITDSVLDVKATNSGIEGKDCVKIQNSDITVDAGSDAIRSTNTEEIDTSGFVYIKSGNVNLTSTNDAIQACSLLRADSGDFEITTGGGSDGNVEQGAFDSNSSKKLAINGGYIYVNASGDGLDSNGALTITGGTVLVSGPENRGNGSIDYDSSGTISGGTLVALGSGGMSQSITGEDQCSIMTDISVQSANTMFSLCDSNGKVIVSFTGANQYSNVVVSTPSIKTGETYSIVSGGTVSNADSNGYAENKTISGGTTVTEITMTDENYSSGSSMMGGGRMQSDRRF